MGFSKHYNTILSTILLMCSVYVKITYKPCILVVDVVDKKRRAKHFCVTFGEGLSHILSDYFCECVHCTVYMYLCTPIVKTNIALQCLSNLLIVNSGSAICVVSGALCKHNCLSFTQVTGTF